MLQKILQEMRDGFKSINARMDRLEADVAELKADMVEVKESLSEVRHCTNALLDWAERSEKIVKVPLIKSM